MSLSEARLVINAVVDFILNSYTESGTAEDLGEMINDQDTATYVVCELEKFAKRNPAKYRKLFVPEPGDVTIRSWVWDILTLEKK